MTDKATCCPKTELCRLASEKRVNIVKSANGSEGRNESSAEASTPVTPSAREAVESNLNLNSPVNNLRAQDADVTARPPVHHTEPMQL